MVLCPVKGTCLYVPEQTPSRPHRLYCESTSRVWGSSRQTQVQGTSSSPQGSLGTNLPQVVQRFFTDVDSLCLGTDFNDLLEEKNHDQQ